MVAESVTWSSDAFPDSERLAAWAEFVSAHFLPLRVECESPQSFWMVATVIGLGPLTLYELRGSGHRLSRAEPHRGGARSGRGDGVVAVVLPMTGRGVARGAGKPLSAEVGFAGLIATDWPSVVEVPDGFHQLVLTFSARLLSPLVSDATATIGGIVAPNDTIGVLRNRLSYLVESAATLDPATARLLSAQLVQLLEFMFRPDAGTVRTHAGMLLQQIQLEIENRLAEPLLTSSSVAAALNISVRYLQQILTNDGTTFNRLLSQRRIERCRAAFDADPGQQVGTRRIAAENGYPDPARFGRTFGRYVGLSPRAYRAQANRLRPLPAHAPAPP